MNVSQQPSRSDILTSYLDDAGSYERLNAPDELEQTRHLVDLRRESWRVALACRGGLKKATKLEYPEQAASITASYWARKSDPKPLVDALMELDPDGKILDRVEASANLSECLRKQIIAIRRKYRDARNRFMCANLKLVVVIAKRYGRSHLPLADRVQEGNLGLLKAIDRFDPERGFRFSTYAAWWIRHSVTRALMKNGRTVRIPAHVHSLFTKVRAARTELRGKLGRSARLPEVADYIGLPLEKVEWATNAMEMRSVGLDTSSSPDDTSPIADVLSDEYFEGWNERIAERIDARLADHLLDQLDEKTMDIMVRRFGLRGARRCTLCAVGKDYGISRERVRQLQVRGLSGLRELVNHSSLPSVALA